MKKKLIIEAFIYLIVVIVGVMLLVFYKPEEKRITVPKDYTATSERSGVNNDIIPKQ